MKLSSVFVNTVLLCIALFMSGAVSNRDGGDSRFWDIAAVVVCRIDKDPSATKNGKIEVTILSVLATERMLPVFEPLKLEFPVMESVFEGNEVKQGALDILCLIQDGGHWALESNRLSFFPSRKAVQPINGVDDPLIGQIQDAVNKVKHEARMREAEIELNTRPSSRPAAQ